MAKLLDRHGLAVVVETGGRYVLDPGRKHQPTLLHEPDQAARRLELLRRAVDVGADLGAEAVSFWCGTLPAGVVARGRLAAAGRRAARSSPSTPAAGA